MCSCQPGFLTSRAVTTKASILQNQSDRPLRNPHLWKEKGHLELQRFSASTPTPGRAWKKTKAAARQRLTGILEIDRKQRKTDKEQERRPCGARKSRQVTDMNKNITATNQKDGQTNKARQMRARERQRQRTWAGAGDQIRDRWGNPNYSSTSLTPEAH